MSSIPNRFLIDSSLQPIPWSSDEFMFPVVPDDPLLMIDIEDDFEDVYGNTPDGEFTFSLRKPSCLLKTNVKSLCGG